MGIPLWKVVTALKAQVKNRAKGTYFVAGTSEVDYFYFPPKGAWFTFIVRMD